MLIEITWVELKIGPLVTLAASLTFMGTESVLVISLVVFAIEIKVHVLLWPVKHWVLTKCSLSQQRPSSDLEGTFVRMYRC